MSAHTPGPWLLLVHPRDIEATGLPVLIGNDAAYVFGVNEAARMANARLIAAAPDLKEACEALLLAATLALGQTPEGGLGQAAICGAIDDGKKALAKAAGK